MQKCSGIFYELKSGAAKGSLPAFRKTKNPRGISRGLFVRGVLSN